MIEPTPEGVTSSCTNPVKPDRYWSMQRNAPESAFLVFQSLRNQTRDAVRQLECLKRGYVPLATSTGLLALVGNSLAR
jgi:hypothetical protein